GSGAQCGHRTDRRPVEEIVLDPERQVVHLVSAPGPRVQDAERPGTGLAVETATREDRHRHIVAQPNPPRLEDLEPLRRAEVEDATRLEEELALLGEE